MADNQQMQTLKGFRDFIGPEAKKRQWLIDIMSRVYERFGFEPFITPTLEYESLLMGKYGEEAEKLIYKFEDNGGRRVAMRYDQTVPTARIIAQYQNQLTFPYRRYQIQPVWRADKPQKGRYREFYQSDIDIFGSSSPIADAEIIATTYALYKEIGIDSLKLKINDRRQLIQAIKNNGVSYDMVQSALLTIDKLDKKSQAEVVDELTQKGIQNGNAIIEDLLKSSPSPELESIMKSAIELGVSSASLVFTPELARGLDYYTGMIFEVYIPEYPVGSVGGGGRYDNLIKDLVGVPMPAVGIGIGFDRTLEAAEVLGKIPQEATSSKVLVTIFNPTLTESSLKTVSYLRSQNIATECYPNEQAKMEKQLKYADRKGIPYVVIIGPEEASKNMILLKNMKTGDQESLPLPEITSRIL